VAILWADPIIRQLRNLAAKNPRTRTLTAWMIICLAAPNRKKISVAPILEKKATSGEMEVMAVM